MPIPSYRLLSLEQPVGRGATRPHYAGISGVAKAHDPNKYTVANEWVAAEIARLLRMPTPPSFITDSEDGDRYFVSLDFSLSREALPPAIPSDVVRKQPRLAGWLVAFDTLIANYDRHDGNLALHPVNGQLMVFDHSHTLFGNGPIGTGPSFLDAVRDEMGILGSRGNRHCLVNEIQARADIRDGAERIASLSETLVREIVQEARDLAVPADEAAFLGNFLTERCHRVGELIERSFEQFPKIEEEDLFT